MYLRIDNIQEFAVNTITDGSDDKKVDLCYLDEESGLIIIAQSYFSQHWGKRAAPANKATSLNSAVAWLFSAEPSQIPEKLRIKALELRKSIISGTIKRIEIIYIHNCFESSNARNELRTVADATRDIVQKLGGTLADTISFSYREMGLTEIEDIYKSRDTNILIDTWIDVPGTSYIEEQGTNWKAVLINIPGNWIHKLYNDYKDKLFSANFRDYLGTIDRKENINQAIKQTASSEPENFWAYNNGITALTHQLEIYEGNIRIRGISIINGAQTSGSLGELISSTSDAVKVLFRIVECKDPQLIERIIRYNNTQNEIKPADRKSNDSTQIRLRREFEQYGITYIHRRSATRTPRNAITASTIAPLICAFNGEPQIAYRNSKDIFNDENTYRRVFRDRITAHHIYLITALSSAIDIIKRELKFHVSNGTATEYQEKQYEILKYSPSKYFILFLIGFVAEEIMGRRISDLQEWKCCSEFISPNMDSIINAWITVLNIVLPQIAAITNQIGDIYDIQRSVTLSTQVGRELKPRLISLTTLLENQLSPIRLQTSL